MTTDDIPIGQGSTQLDYLYHSHPWLKSCVIDKQSLLDQSSALIKDVLENHLPQLKADLESGVPAEHQALTILDHLIRARVFQHAAKQQASIQ